jgi:hypothetical protein
MRGIRAVLRNRKRTQEYRRQARHLLMELDPIGVSDTPEAAGEYDCMIGPLLHRLSRGTVSITSRPHHPFRRCRDYAGAVLAPAEAAMPVRVRRLLTRWFGFGGQVETVG